MVLSKNILFATVFGSIAFAATGPVFAQEVGETILTVGGQTASDFPDFGMEVPVGGVTFDATRKHTERFSGSVWLRLAPNEDWDGLDPVATEVDATGTYVVYQGRRIRVSTTGGVYIFPADDWDATTWTLQGAVSYQMNERLSFSVEHGEYFAGFEEGRTKAFVNASFPLGNEFWGDVEVGASVLRELETNPVFLEFGVSRDNWRIAAVGWMNTDEDPNGERASGLFLKASATL